MCVRRVDTLTCPAAAAALLPRQGPPHKRFHATLKEYLEFTFSEAGLQSRRVNPFKQRRDHTAVNRFFDKGYTRSHTHTYTFSD